MAVSSASMSILCRNFANLPLCKLTFVKMKKYNWIVGITFSIGMSIIGTFQLLLRLSTDEISRYLAALLYYSGFTLFCWYFSHMLFASLLSKKKAINKTINKILYVVTGILVSGVFSYLTDIVYNELVPPRFHLAPDIHGDRRLMLITFRGMIIGGLSSFLSYYLYILWEKQQTSLEIERLKQAHLQAKLSSLKEQLSPHFLFNTFNTLTTLTRESSVKDFVNELSNVYRYILQTQSKNYVLVATELGGFQSYLHILNARFGQSLRITIHIEPRYYNCKIPPLVLQMLAENAVKHNIVLQSRPLHITVVSKDDLIVVENTYQPRQSVEHTTGIGLNNIIERYGILFDKVVEIEKTDQVFRVKLPIVL